MANQDSLQSLFDQAQKELAAKDYPHAQETLKKIKSNGYSSASVEATLARAFYETGEVGQALVAWNRAIALDRFNGTYRADLALAEQKIEGSVATRMEHPAEFANTIASYARPAELFFAGALLLLIFIWLRLAGLLKDLSVSLRVLWVSVVVGLALFGTFGLSSKSLAIVVVKAPLKPAPLESAEASTELSPGTRVRILKTSGDFVEIERPNSFRGWVSKDLLETSAF